MCIVSNVGDYWRETFPDRWPNYVPTPQPITWPSTSPPAPITIAIPEIKKEDFDALKKEVEELKKLLIAAKIYDEPMGEPDCEMDEKIALIRAIAEKVGVDVDEVFGKTS